MDPERITRGVISLTTGDSRRGSLGSIFRFLGLCVCLGVQRGLSRVLIKYSGNVRLQIYCVVRVTAKATDFNFFFLKSTLNSDQCDV